MILLLAPQRIFTLELCEASSHFCEVANCWTNASENLEHGGTFSKLAILYRSGCGVKQSDSEAEVLWRRAAELGHSSAQANLGSIFPPRIWDLDD